VRLGLNRFQAENDIEFGMLTDTREDIDGGELIFLGRIDTFDHSYFPTMGTKATLKFIKSRSELGSDLEFDQVELDGLKVFTSGNNEHSFFLGLRYYSTLKGEAPVQNRFRLGGLFTLPGFVSNELSGQHLYLLRSAYQRRINKVLGTSPYFGLTIQYGNIFQDKDKISLSDGITAGGIWLGWDTAIGPIYFGYGRTDTEDQSMYISVGSFF